MSTATKTRFLTIILNTPKARQWIDENIAIRRSQWIKDEDTGNIGFILESIFIDELVDEMAEDLAQDIDFTVRS